MLKTLVFFFCAMASSLVIAGPCDENPFDCPELPPVHANPTISPFGGGGSYPFGPGGGGSPPSQYWCATPIAVPGTFLPNVTR